MKKYYMTKPRAIEVEELSKSQTVMYFGHRVDLEKGDFIVKDSTGRRHPYKRDIFLKVHYEITQDVYEDEKRKETDISS